MARNCYQAARTKFVRAGTGLSVQTIALLLVVSLSGGCAAIAEKQQRYEAYKTQCIQAGRVPYEGSCLNVQEAEQRQAHAEQLRRERVQADQNERDRKAYLQGECIRQRGIWMGTYCANR